MTMCCEMVSQDKKNMVVGNMVSQDQGNMVVGDMVSTDLGETGVVGNFMVSQDKENMVVGDMVSMDLGETGTDQEEPKEDMVLINLVCKSLITDQSDH